MTNTTKRTPKRAAKIDAYAEGRTAFALEARERGDARLVTGLNNPYAPMTRESSEWRRGFNDAMKGIN